MLNSFDLGALRSCNDKVPSLFSLCTHIIILFFSSILFKFFQATRSVGLAATPNNGNVSTGKQNQDLNEVFNPAQSSTSRNIAISITDVAWSKRQHNDESLGKSRSKSNDYTDMSQSSTSDGQKNEVPATTDTKKDPFQSIVSMPDDLLMADDSLIAAAGSNGVVVVWRTCDILGGGIGGDDLKFSGRHFFGRGGGGDSAGRANKNNMQSRESMDPFLFLHQSRNHQRRNDTRGNSAIGKPEAILVEHNRAVNCIAWHRHRPGIFLTGSQDGTVKMFERREVKKEGDIDSQKRSNENYKWKWFAKSTSSTLVKSYVWHYTGCFKPNCGPIRDIKWSHGDDDLFAMVTNNGFLVVHNMAIMNNGRPMVRIAAHAREATTLDWHPTEPYIIATGSVDRTVKGMMSRSQYNRLFVFESTQKFCLTFFFSLGPGK